MKNECILYGLPLLRKRNGKRISCRKHPYNMETQQTEAPCSVDRKGTALHIGKRQTRQ